MRVKIQNKIFEFDTVIRQEDPDKYVHLKRRSDNMHWKVDCRSSEMAELLMYYLLRDGYVNLDRFRGENLDYSRVVPKL